MSLWEALMSIQKKAIIISSSSLRQPDLMPGNQRVERTWISRSTQIHVHTHSLHIVEQEVSPQSLHLPVYKNGLIKRSVSQSCLKIKSTLIVVPKTQKVPTGIY
jgi:hypothetical protein